MSEELDENMRALSLLETAVKAESEDAYFAEAKHNVAHKHLADRLLEKHSLNLSKSEPPPMPNPHEITGPTPLSDPDYLKFDDFFGTPYPRMKPYAEKTAATTGQEGEPKKRLTAAQQARKDREDAELQAIADEAERRRIVEEERVWNLPLIPRHVFNGKTREKVPSISPRDKLSYTSDKKYTKEIERFHEKNPLAHKFIVMLHSQILAVKPENICDYLAEEFFSEANEAKIRAEMQRQEMVLRELM